MPALVASVGSRPGDGRPRRRSRRLAWRLRRLKPAPRTTITIEPEADTFVSGTSPGTNFGATDYFDTYGGFSSSCVSPPVQPLSARPTACCASTSRRIPAGAVISDARIVATTRAGYAQDGDGNHHAIFLADDTWSETGVTWNTRPDDAPSLRATASPPVRPRPCVPRRSARTGGDVRSSPQALGSDFVFRATCDAGPRPAATRPRSFPTNDQDFWKTFADSQGRPDRPGADERAGDGKLSIELYNPNCDVEHRLSCRHGVLGAVLVARGRRPGRPPVPRGHVRRPTTTPGPAPRRSASTGPATGRRRGPSTSPARLAGTASRSSPAPGRGSTSPTCRRTTTSPCSPTSPRRSTRRIAPTTCSS